MDILLSDSEWDTVSESGSSEDQEEIEFLYGGQAQSILSSLDESIGKIDDFLSFERGFVYGDTVCAVADPSGQMGRVENVNMLVDLENLRGQIMKDVNSKKLSKIRSISVGDHVIYGSWLGRVTKVVDCVTVLFDDGAKCEVTVNGEEKLIPTSPNLLEDSQYLYYPGQRVRMRSSAASTSARWLCGTWKGNQTAGTVCGVKPGLIYVDWLASVLDGPESRCRAPPCLQDPEKLTLLSCFSHASWQLGDWCMLPKADNMDPLNSTSYDFSEDHNDGRKEFTRDFNSNLEDIFVIVKTKTKIDVLWQDGSRSRGLDSQTLLPKDVVNAHEFLPGQFVLEKSAIEDQSNPAKNRWGFVRSVDAKEQIVEVTWKFRHSTGINDASQDWTEETVSAYELIEHPDYSYSFGDVVFRLAGNDDLENNCEDNGEDIGKCYLSCIGIVTGIRDGNVEVEWAVGPKSKVAPSEVFRLSKDEGPPETSTICEENVEQTNQEPIQQERQSLIDKGKGLSDAYCDIDQSKNCCWESSSFSLPRCAIGAFSSLLGNLFGSFSSTLFGGPMSTSLVYEDDQKCGALNEKQEASDICTETQPMLINEFQASERSTSEVGVEEIHKIKDVLHSSVGMFPDKFRQFDMVTDCSDHCFLDSAGRGCAPTQVQRNWLKKVQQEWSILEKNLPETIYVRVYEERIDLMRAALVGSPGTPYHDGLFFFDIYLPPEYPNEPPSVFYHSGGLRINPNLYESGKVCLSLLNTWTGTGTEVWNPGSSTILQVLLSLQALVLNEKPYFNEAGYDLQIGKAEGEKNSVSYNENAFLVTCKSMLYLLRKPPKNFEDLVEEHFRKCSQRILMACKAYMDGAPVGCAFGNIDTGSKKGSSTGFKIMLGKILPKVVEAFADKGIDCSHFQP